MEEVQQPRKVKLLLESNVHYCNKTISVLSNISLDELKRKVANKLGISPSSFIWQHYDTAFDPVELAEVDEEYELPEKSGKLKITCQQDNATRNPEQLQANVKPLPAVGTKIPENIGVESTDSVPAEKKTDDKAFPMCLGPPEKSPAVQGDNQTPSNAARAHINKDKIWTGRQNLKVYFMTGDTDPQTKKYDEEYSCIEKWERGFSKEPLRTGTIMDWAQVWRESSYPNIPRFERTGRIKGAHIRVKCSDEGQNWSMVGTDAVDEVDDEEKPTMMLSLKGYDENLQRSLVIHEFGHALGLEHEHQRSDFWEVLGKHFDQDQMMKDPRLNRYGTVEEKKAAFGRDWLPKKELGEGVIKSEYDPESIMHYRFETEWIREEKYRSRNGIEEDTVLTDKEKQYLKGLIKGSKCGQLPKEPSPKDRKELQNAYGDKAVPDEPSTIVQTTPFTSEKIWKNRDTLFVYFMDSVDSDVKRGKVPEEDYMCIKDWKCRGQHMSINTIIAWARVWNSPVFPEIPYFEVTERPGRADIRVRFSNTEENWSMVGIDAQSVADDTKPTMILNLTGLHSTVLTAEQMESRVVHEFGHALGLEHEHQRFWDVMEKYLNLEKMKSDHVVNPTVAKDGGPAFERDWIKSTELSAAGCVGQHSAASAYDPTSIMHYWFDVNWLKDDRLAKYENINKVVQDEKERAVLKGLHKIYNTSGPGVLPKKPSMMDYRRLVEAYGRKVASSPQLDALKTGKPARIQDANAGLLSSNKHLSGVQNALQECASKWKELGSELMLDPCDSDTALSKQSDEENLATVIETWMSSGKATIFQLLAGLESLPVDRKDVADNLRAKVGLYT